MSSSPSSQAGRKQGTRNKVQETGNKEQGGTDIKPFIYYNADTQKLSILLSNKDKSGVYL